MFSETTRSIIVNFFLNARLNQGAGFEYTCDPLKCVDDKLITRIKYTFLSILTG